MDVLGLDIGGANLKAAHTHDVARLRPFALWKDPAGLADALRGLLRGWPPFDLLAVTMTGELCDCFESKRQGVAAILDAVEAAAGGLALDQLGSGGGGTATGTDTASQDPTGAAPLFQKKDWGRLF